MKASDQKLFEDQEKHKCSWVCPNFSLVHFSCVMYNNALVLSLVRALLSVQILANIFIGTVPVIVFQTVFGSRPEPGFGPEFREKTKSKPQI